ncbi:LAFA_0G02168g1_1 [Lachancea sp. 'fantastica']|nr:LAFA_0G02168g1_1 [Lachancea sp. 'fantastica']
MGIHHCLIGFLGFINYASCLEDALVDIGQTNGTSPGPNAISPSIASNDCSAEVEKLEQPVIQVCDTPDGKFNMSTTNSTIGENDTEINTSFARQVNPDPVLISITASDDVSPLASVCADVEQNDNDTRFLSFDEWKELKLSQDSKREVHPDLKLVEHSEPSGFRSETIGDELEIDVGLFTSHGSSADEEPEGKLYKDRFNYASLGCAATIVKTNSEASGANSILHENKDKYLLTPCSASSKFVVIELCQDILVEQIAIANYEFFSSTFQTLRFSVSDRFPPKNGWKVLGEFQANNTRNIQKFDIPNPLIWARYARVEVLSHFGNEFYCPISVVRVHGKTMMDDVKLGELEERYNQEQEIARKVEKKTKECIEEEMAVLSSAGAVLDKCQLPDFTSNPNLTGISNIELGGAQCPTVLPFLEFDQFLRNFNQSICDPSKFQNAPDTSSTLPSSSTEESIFKTIIKRLSLLESNSTLSLRYIEEQSKLISKAFSHSEKNQARKFDALVDALNQTILSSLGDLNVFSQQLRESSLKALDEQKLLNDQLVAKTLESLERVKRDAIFQQRLSYTMLFAFATLLVYVLLAKEAYVDEPPVDDGWYLNSPPLQRAKNTLLMKTNNDRKPSGPLVFEAGRENQGTEYKSDISASTSSTSLYEEFDSEDDKVHSRERNPVKSVESFD